MNQRLKTVLVQSDIVWMNVPRNLIKYENFLGKIDQEVDLILLPEMFATGFVLDPTSFSADDQKAVMDWMLRMAGRFNACISGSHPFYHEGRYFNRFLAAFPDGSLTFYDKRHLFTIGGEKQHFTAGNDRLVFDVKGWKLMPLICYDLRFPVWSRNNVKYDLLLFAANWPKVRNHVWEILLKARAIENQSYVIGINRIGIDGRSIEYFGQSQVISPKGEIIARLSDREDLLTVSLSKIELDRFRKDFPVLDDADNFTIG